MARRLSQASLDLFTEEKVDQLLCRFRMGAPLQDGKRVGNEECSQLTLLGSVGVGEDQLNGVARPDFFHGIVGVRDAQDYGLAQGGTSLADPFGNLLVAGSDLHAVLLEVQVVLLSGLDAKDLKEASCLRGRRAELR